MPPPNKSSSNGAASTGRAPASASPSFGLSTAAPRIVDLPVRWEDSFAADHFVDPPVPLPLGPFDEKATATAAGGTGTGTGAVPSGRALHALLAEDAAQSAAQSAELARLQGELSRHTRDTTAMVKYLESELRRKDVMGRRMGRQLDDMRTTHAEEVASMQAHFENTAREMERLFLDKEKQMLALNEQLESDIVSLSDLSAQRRSLAQELEETKSLIFTHERSHRLQLDGLERRFIAARDGLQAEAAARIAAARANYRSDVGRELEEESTRVRTENERLKRQLRERERTSDRLQRDHSMLTSRIHQQKQEMELRQQQQEEYQRKEVRQTKRIELLTRETAAMEAELLAALAEAEQARMAREQSLIAAREPLEQSLLQARLAAREVDRENAALRREARAMLGRRKELESFFLAAIEETRGMERRREQLQRKEAQLVQAAQLRELTLPPSLRSMGTGTRLPAIHGAAADAPDASTGSGAQLFSSRATLGDLTLTERSKVLRLLYAKLTHVPSALAVSMPPHSFDITAAAAANPALVAGGATAARSASTAALPAPPAAPSSPPPAPLPLLSAGSAADDVDAPSLADPPPPALQGASYDDVFLTNMDPEAQSEEEEEEETEMAGHNLHGSNRGREWTREGVEEVD